MSMSQRLSLKITDAAVIRILSIIDSKNNPKLKLRIYIVGGGCSGFQYKFLLDETVQIDDCYIKKNGVTLVVDPMSLQYLRGGSLDYYEGLEGSRFVIINPNAKITCSCGLSFSI